MIAWIQFLDSCLRVSTPLVFAALGGLFSESVGVTNIALEGTMLVGAFGAVVMTFFAHSVWIGAIGGMLSGVLFSIVFAFFVIELRANQIVAGMAMNMLAIGITPFLSKILYDSSTSTPSLPLDLRFQFAPIGIAFVCVGLIQWVMTYTPLGLWIRFAGENPEALDSAGIGVKKVRWVGVLLSGCLAGLGGASLSVFLASSFSRNMTAGRGFMALAALIFGRWKPIPTCLACLFFGCSDVLQIRFQGAVLFGQYPIPGQLVQILPYIVTIFILVGVVGESRAPKALGQPFPRV